MHTVWCGPFSVAKQSLTFAEDYKKTANRTSSSSQLPSTKEGTCRASVFKSKVHKDGLAFFKLELGVTDKVLRLQEP